MDSGGQNWGFDGSKKHTTLGEKRSPPSLIISPNLDALLEYEERIRGSTSQLREGTPMKDSPQPSPYIASPPVGLLPPPRKRQKPQSPTGSQTDSPAREHPLQGVTPSLSTSPKLTEPLASNPYINSPPSFNEIRELEDEQLSPVDETRTVAATDSPRDGPVDGRKRRRTHQRSRSSGDEKRPKSQQSTVSPPASPTNHSPTKQRVDKFFNIKNTFGLSQKTELYDVSNAALASRSRHSPQPSPKHSDRSRLKGKFFKRDSSSGDPDSNMPKVNEETVLDIRPQVLEVIPVHSTTDLSEIVFRRRRPLLSHDSSLPSSSRSSLDSSASDTTNGPASTIEPRISISSTIYPTSSSHSHPHFMYQSTDQHATAPARKSTSPPRRQSDADRASFIDFALPTRRDFALKDDRSPPATFHHFQSKSQPATRSSSPKPPVPTAPKPVFDRSSLKTSPRLRQHDEPEIPLPPTTNFLDIEERLELIRKNQKLARLLGQSPGPDATVSPLTRHLHGALSMSNNPEITVHVPFSTRLAATASNGRRHSISMSSDDLSFLSDSGNNPIRIDHSSRSNDPELHSVSTTSFIDLSDDLGSAAHDRPMKAVTSISYPSTQSLLENMSPEEQAEEERKRKRQKLVKLHRFLGSRVPTGLVLGVDCAEVSLPPEIAVNGVQDEDDVSRKMWMRRRRSSSAAVFPSTWSDDLDRLKEDLNNEEKAINVRRAQKMEKVFGIAPPQTLYHTRRSPSPSLGPNIISSLKSRTGYLAASENHPAIFQRNPNRTSYMKPKSKINDRPGTSESNKQLLPKGRSSADLDDSPTHTTVKKPSIVYSHYQHSLNSLNDIIDRDDKESLAELHEYLSHGDVIVSPRLQEFSRIGDRQRSSTSSIKSERRRSLPTNASVISVVSDYSITAPRPEAMDFQARRRRAAKLTQFFGVNYRELISDVLESIENGLEHEQKRGTMNPDEVEELFDRLRKLRTKREGLF